MPKSDIPFGSEFGPNQVNLGTVLDLAQQYAGNGDGLTDAVARLYGWPRETAKNTRLGLRSYGLLAGDDRLTELGELLLSLADIPAAMHEEFARHILLNLHGLEVVTAIDAMRKADEEVTLTSLSAYLKPLGLYVPTTGTHLSKLRGWLAQADVFTRDRGFDSLDMRRVHSLLGTADDKEIDFLAELAEEQRSFLKALATMPMPAIPDISPILASDVVAFASTLYGTSFNEKGLVRITLAPLQLAGFITIDKPPKATGATAGTRKIISGKSTLIYRTEKFANEYLLPLVDALAGTGLAVRELMRKPLSEILAELKSPDRNVKGKALESLAFYFTRLLDLEFRAWRHRGKETGGAEVDVIVEGVRLVFSRWHIVCKNSDQITLDDVAIQVGLSPCLKTQVILIVTPGIVTAEARRFIRQAMEMNSFLIAVVDGDVLAALTTLPNPKQWLRAWLQEQLTRGKGVMV